MTENARIGSKVSVYEMPEKEATDIDSVSDWVVCEQELKKKRIILRADGYKALGMGHIYHCLTLAYNLTAHDIIFVTKEEHKQGLQKILDSHMKVRTIVDDEDFFQFVREWKPDVVVNDCLNTEVEYIQTLKKYVKRVVTIEDIGPGAEYADAVINALYEDRNRKNNYFWGEKYTCLRDEFMVAKPSKFHEEVKNVVIIFGGTDPCNFTKRIYHMARKMHLIYPNIKYTFVLGAGYDGEKNSIESIENENILVVQDVKRMSQIFVQADMAFTSQGRTVYELATMGVPAIVMAQNDREMRHSFAQMRNGFLNLGLGKEVEDETIERTFKWLVETPQIREEMRTLMLKHELRTGVDRVIELILKENK